MHLWVSRLQAKGKGGPEARGARIEAVQRTTTAKKTGFVDFRWKGWVMAATLSA